MNLTELQLTKLQEECEGKKLRALGQLISLIEDGAEEAYLILEKIYSPQKKAKVVGMTGAPGVGKSSLINLLIPRFLGAGKYKKIAVIAVDPISPFSGGSILGDRIRFQEHFTNPHVYIRSLSTRGKLGGLSVATAQVIHALEAFDFDLILVETVGVGQSEVAIEKVASLNLFVLVPEWGDQIQAIKSGIVEIADIFVVHKSDRQGAEQIVANLNESLSMMGRKAKTILCTSEKEAKTIDTLFQEIEKQLLISCKTKQEETAEWGLFFLDFLIEKLRPSLQEWLTKEQNKKQNRKEILNPYTFLTELKNVSVLFSTHEKKK